MLGVNLENPARVLFLGAHSDDIEIGCGATVLRLVEEFPQVEITWVVLSAENERRAEAEASAAAFLGKHRRRRVLIQDFRGSFFPYQGEALKSYVETLKEVRPDIVFTHYRHDLHQDHRIVNELTWNTFRNQRIFEYEIPKFDGDLGVPNFFIPVKRAHVDRKSRLLLKHFASQRNKHWFTDELFRSLPRLRGMECATATNFAEAFYTRKLVLADAPARRRSARKK
ncbi:MAG TPA: PIG-L deacetylase family protein [Steroidobacteraceae bacterium]|jgi:LmbE family N-acetylglucosaminyl deacetylase|nr:PIG-L deacetylase family protein [Steroidobacteraceae bacterium]